jgi:hypothetical protein
MREPPDLKCERAALADGPESHSDKSCTEIPSESIREYQAASLRKRFALAHYFAAVVASLAWGALPR